jgi:hypothetical protein
MILSAAQPYFAPFPGFFYKARLSDVFIILDEVQFPRGTTWITRNRFKNHQGTLWITIPVWKKGLGLQPINGVNISREGRWEKKHLESLKNAYARAPYFPDHAAFIERMFSEPFERLLDLNMAIMTYLWQHLKIQTDIALLSDLGISETGDGRLIQICKAMGASRFLAQRAAKKYLDITRFREAGVALDFVTPPSLVYPQLWGDFIPNLSAFDLVLNCGPKASDIMMGRPGKD